MIKHIFFDADDTLMDFGRAERTALSEVLQELGIPPTPQILTRYSEINRSYWKRLEQKTVTREELKYRRYEDLLAEFGYTHPAEDIAARYEHRLGEQYFLIDGARELLATLAPDYHMYLASNGSRSVQHRRIDGTGLKHYFEGIFISQEVGFDKPDPRFFEVAFASIPHFRKEEAVIIGDSLTSDIAGGIHAGIRTVWFDPQGQPPRPDLTPTATVKTLAELPELLRGMI